MKLNQIESHISKASFLVVAFALTIGSLHAAEKKTKRTIALEAVPLPSEVLTGPECGKKDFDVIEVLQSTLKKHPALDYGKLLTEEQKNDKDNPDLNWVRAVNPWDLPADFPVRPGFIRCAGSLRTAVDTRTEEAIEEWNLCWKSLYGESSAPAEFESISRCLSSKN